MKNLLFRLLLLIAAVLSWVVTKIKSIRIHPPVVWVRQMPRALRPSGAVCAAMAIFLAMNAPYRARAQVSPFNLYNLTNVPAVLTNGTPIPTTNIFLLTRDCDLAFAGHWYGSNGFSAVAIGGSFSLDTTNFGLAPFVIFCGTNITASSSNTSPVWTNWTHTQIAGFTAVNFTSFTNLSGGTPVTNVDAKINRPTINTQTY